MFHIEDFVGTKKEIDVEIDRLKKEYHDNEMIRKKEINKVQTEIMERYRNQLFNYYDAVGKNLSTDIQNWVTSFEEGVDYEKRIEQRTVRQK